MTARGSILGWLGAGVVSALLLAGAAALAIGSTPPSPVMLDLGQRPPAAPAIAAIAEAAPQIADELPAFGRPLLPEAAPLAPSVLTAPRPAAMGAPVHVRQADVLAQSDLALPAQDLPPKLDATPPKLESRSIRRPKRMVKADRPRETRLPEQRKVPEPRKEQNAKARPEANPARPPPSAGSVAPRAGQIAKGGAREMSEAAYAKAVMKKVRGTPKKSGAGRGVVVVGFTVADHGGLDGIQVIRSSGNAALDQVAVSHIQRSVPFPAPPTGARRSFSFEFVGR